VLRLDASRVAMVGDDVETDVVAAQRLGLTGVLVRTGKFDAEQVRSASPAPHHVVDSVKDLPRLLQALGKMSAD
jgi:ribonucleotide monophosphatase NagD (HAD superfamily)